MKRLILVAIILIAVLSTVAYAEDGCRTYIVFVDGEAHVFFECCLNGICNVTCS